MIDDLLTMSEIIQMVTDVRTKDASFIQKFAEFMPAYGDVEIIRVFIARRIVADLLAVLILALEF